MSLIPKFNWQTLLFKCFPLGFGTAITANFLLVANKFAEAMIAFGVTVFYSLLASFIEGFIKGVNKKTKEKGQDFGEAFVEYLLTDVPQKLRWKLSRFEKRYRQSLIDYYRDLKIEGFKIGLPVLDLEDVFVPLKVATEIPQNIKKEMISDCEILGNK